MKVHRKSIFLPVFSGVCKGQSPLDIVQCIHLSFGLWSPHEEYLLCQLSEK